MSRNGDSQGQELTSHHHHPVGPEPSTTAKLTWQWQKKASLRNIENLSSRIENSLSDVRERLCSIQTEVETSRKEDKREIKLLLDDLAVSRAKSTRLEKTIEEMKKDKLNILKMHEELLNKKEEEIKTNLKSYEETMTRKDEELRNVRKEAKECQQKLRAEHDAHVVQLENQQTQKIAALIKDKDKMKSEFEQKLTGKCKEIKDLHSKYQEEEAEVKQNNESNVNELNEKIDELKMKLADSILYLKNSLHLIELKNSFIARQRQGFEKIIEHVGESSPKAVHLKGNLWKIAHYNRTGGQQAYKGYINRAQWEAANDDADAILRISQKRISDFSFETEDEPPFRAALKEMQCQLSSSS